MKYSAFNLGWYAYFGLPPKILMIVKLVVVILFSCLMQVSASTFGQRVTLSEKNATLENVFQKIRIQTGYDFFFDADIVKSAKKVNVSLQHVALDEALDQLFSGQNLQYTIENKSVIVSKKSPSFLERIQSAFADRDVRGRVVDEQGNPMPNASIQIKGTSKVTTSNDKGEFLIKDVAEDAVLVIRYVGYKALEIPVKGASMPLEIKLNQLTGQLEEVAVKGNTGYQVIDKNHPGSFDVIDNQLLNRSTSSSILERIQNLTPGLLFDKTPGAKEPIMIRGKNSIALSAMPLIVLDNFPYNGNINNINPNERGHCVQP